MSVSNETLGNAFILVGKAIKSGDCEISQEQADDVFKGLQNAVDIPVSKEEACRILGVSRSTFDLKVAEGKIPQGRHRMGFKEKVWMKKDLMNI